MDGLVKTLLVAFSEGFFILRDGAAHVVVAVEACFHHCGSGSEYGSLFEISDAQTVAECHVARILVLFAGDGAQKGRLSCAVFCDYTDFVAFVHSESHVSEQHPVAVTFSEILYLKEACSHV